MSEKVQLKVQFKKDMSTFSLMMTGVTSIIGSGWLLATQKISSVAGPAGLLAWVVGMVVAMLIALFCIEIGSVNPSAGGLGYYSSITHGRFSGFLTQWINWLSILPVPAVEAQAIVIYLSGATPALHDWYNVDNSQLTPLGITVAIGFVIFFMLVNYWGLKLFTRFNNALTLIKVTVPVLTILFLVYEGFHPGNFGHNMQEFAPYGLKSIGTAVITCGVIMSFNGFQLPLNFSEEIKSPKTQLPIAIIGSIVFSFLLYIGLQATFIGSLNPSQLINGWHGVNLRSPYVDLLIAANFQVMAWSVMSTSAIAPAACGAAFSASTARMMFNLARAKMLPSYINKLDDKYASPRRALVINTILGCFFLLAFKGWSQLVAVISVLHIFSYISMPVVVVAYRKQQTKRNPASKDVFRLPFASFFGVAVLFILALLIFFAGWDGLIKMTCLLLLGLVFYIYFENKYYKETLNFDQIKRGAWMLYFLLGICVITYFGNKSDADNLISTELSVILLFVLSLTSFIYGVVVANRAKLENI